MLAETYLQTGNLEQGLETLKEARSLAASNEEHMWEAELARLEGEIRWALGASLEEVEAHMQSAIHIAQRQSAKSFELRAAMSLARSMARGW